MKREPSEPYNQRIARSPLSMSAAEAADRVLGAKMTTLALRTADTPPTPNPTHQAQHPRHDDEDQADRQRRENEQAERYPTLAALSFHVVLKVDRAISRSLPLRVLWDDGAVVEWAVTVVVVARVMVAVLVLMLVVVVSAIVMKRLVVLMGVCCHVRVARMARVTSGGAGIVHRCARDSLLYGLLKLDAQR